MPHEDFEQYQEICGTCNGSGEGHADGTTCCRCKGRGEVNHELEEHMQGLYEDELERRAEMRREDEGR